MEPFRTLLARHGYTADNLPLGTIVATGFLENCHEVTAGLTEEGWPGGTEYMLGDYSEGRFAWELGQMSRLVQPVPVKGKLGLWEYPGLETKI
ncbi:hypothetical protein D3C73_1362660 [compost metagenome]